MDAFQKAAGPPSTTNKPLPSKNKFVSKTSFKASVSNTSYKPSGGNATVGKLNFKKGAFKPSVSTSTAKTTKPSVGKLNKNMTNVIASVLSPSDCTSSSPGPGGSKSTRESKSSTPFEKCKLTAGANTSQEQQGQASMSEKAKHALVAPKEIDPDKQDWKFLYELSVQYEELKLQLVEETKNPNAIAQSGARLKAPTQRHEAGDTKNIGKSLEGLMGGSNLTANGNFLTKEYMDEYLVENKKFHSLTFDFSGQSKLFKRFDRKDSEQRTISQKFVEVLLQHPRSKEITHLNMSNAMLPDVFLVALAEECLGKNGLPNLRVLNLESNLIAKSGVLALCKCLLHSNVWKRLQMLKLENQKMQFPSDAEEALGEALLETRNLVVVSLRVRGGLSKQQIDNSVAYNIDILRQARRHHAADSGTMKERKRNEMEQYFDKIAADVDPSITTVDLTGNLKFLGLHASERLKAATAFATNTTVKTIKMVKLKLDDAFAKEFAKALSANTTLEKVCLDSNEISGAGIKALIEGLGQNTSIIDFQVRHQSKTMASADEPALPGLLVTNKTIVKVGVDVRNPLIKTQLEKKMNENRDWQRKQRLAAKKQ
eukprot:scaffold35161_cov153-Amphora_coffeaeformis.AAC.3